MQSSVIGPVAKFKSRNKNPQIHEGRTPRQTQKQDLDYSLLKSPVAWGAKYTLPHSTQNDANQCVNAPVFHFKFGLNFLE